MRCRATFLALLALAFAAQGARVSQSDAVGAARVWAGSGEKLGVRLGAGVESVREFAVTNGYSFYAVGLGGGTVIMSSDTTMEPVVAFSSRGDLDFSEGGPLFKLLRGDIAARAALVGKAGGGTKLASVASSAAASTSSGSASALWSALLGKAQQAKQSQLTSASAKPVKSVSDVRVAPLVKSEWSQDFADKMDTINCYNYYTPNNYVCGCTATAMSQIMRYFEWPKAEMEPREYDCEVDGAAQKLTTQGGIYDWANMTLVPAAADGLSEANCQAIGKLTSDAGIAVKSSYSDGDTGADPEEVAAALRGAFGYPDAICYWNEAGWNTGSGGLHSLALRKRVVYANLDAGQPVQLAIYGYSAGHIGDSSYWAGHAVVADGYGYMNVAGVETAFVHVNMGWAGSDDMWYNIPEIDAANSGAHIGDSGFDFLYLGGAVFNISTNDTGLAILSGRAADENGAAVAGATVRVLDEGGAVVGETSTDDCGIYFFKLAGGANYRLTAEDASGDLLAEDIPYTYLPATVGISDKYVVTDSTKIGNSWGNDFLFMDPRVRIVSGGVTNIYSTLDRALTAAHDIARDGETPVLEILRDVDLRNDVDIAFACELRAATGDLSSTVVNRPGGAAVNVVHGGSLVVSNCDFEVTGEVPLIAAAGGRIFIGPGFSAERVSTTDVMGFNVIGHVDSDLAVECKAARAEGDVFGYATTDDFVAFSNSLSRLYATFSEDFSVRAEFEVNPGGGYRLVWSGGVDVPLGSSVGYYVSADGKTNAFALVDSLVENFESALADGRLGSSPELVFIGLDKNGLSRDIVVDGISLVMRGESDAVLTPLDASHIVVTNGGSLVVRDLVVCDREGDTFVRVYDGTMTLGAGAALENLVCTGNFDYAGAGSAPTALHAGPIAVMAGGTFRLDPGASIVGCSASGNAYGGDCGGGVYVAPGGTIELVGGSIENCQAASGGGVYAELGANVVVSGPSVVSGNADGKGDSDIYLLYNAGDVNRITVTKTAAGGSMGVRYSNGSGNAVGFVFATATALTSPGDRDATAAAFFNDANSAKVAVAESTNIKWIAAEDVSDDPQPVTDQSLAFAKVDYPSSYTKYGSTAYWASAQDAFWSLEGITASGKATVTLLREHDFDTNIVVNCTNCTVTLTSATTEAIRLRRYGDFSIIVDGASLTVDNVEFADRLIYYFDRDSGEIVPYAAEQPFFDVTGGELALDGATITGVVSDGRFGAAITATEGATVTLRNGAEISGCENMYEYTADNTSYAGAILADGEGTKVVLEDCTVTGCSACRTGGVCIDNGATVEISGSATVSGNETSEGDEANLTVAASSSLILAGKLTGDVGVRRDVAADRMVFGSVSSSFSGSDSDLVTSAMKFKNDDTGDCGAAVRTADKKNALLVWLSSLGEDDTYTDQDGVEYTLVTASGVQFTVNPPVAVTGLVYNGEEQTGVAAGRGYTLTGVAVATGAGDYAAVARPAAGYVWSDGSTAAKTIRWKISKAELDLSGISFEDATFFYDGTPKSLAISGDLPDGVTVSYTGNEWTQPGAYTVTATFAVDGDDYIVPDDMTATLTIMRSVAIPAGVPGLVYTAAEQTGVAAGEGYTLSGDVSGVNAGTNYVAVASLDGFCVWEDGSTEDAEIVWSIGPAPLAVTAKDGWKLLNAADPAEFAYTVSGLKGDDTAGNVLTGRISRIEGEALGAYRIVQGTLAVVENNPNYTIDSFVTGVFRILLEEPQTPPDDDPAQPVGVAFTSVSKTDGMWTVTFTTAVEKCWYSLYATNSLSGGFGIKGVDPVERRQAGAEDVPTMKFERPYDGTMLFWRIVAEPEDAH